MKESYTILSKKDSKELSRYLAKEGQFLLPMLDLIEQAETAVDEVIDVVGRSAIEAILLLSARQVAGYLHKGKAAGDIRWHGSQTGVISLAERKLRVIKPRLRKKGKGAGKEVTLPAYTAMQENGRLSQRILFLLMQGISTRSYEKVLPAMAETVGVSKSQVSREWIEATDQQIRQFTLCRLDGQDILIVYIDGIHSGEHLVIAAVGVDSEGNMQVLGLVEGFTENAAIVKELLIDIVSRELDTHHKRLFIIDGSKALRSAINEIFGNTNPILRCRKHKVSNCGC